MRPPGPLADSKMVTDTPCLARLDAHTAPETAHFFCHFSRSFVWMWKEANLQEWFQWKRESWFECSLPLPTTATLLPTLFIVIPRIGLRPFWQHVIVLDTDKGSRRLVDFVMPECHFLFSFYHLFSICFFLFLLRDPSTKIDSRLNR